jgi:hypothetical protein
MHGRQEQEGDVVGRLLEKVVELAIQRIKLRTYIWQGKDK